MDFPQKLYLIDGHALIYRAHFAFARNPLINSKGQHTSAVFGFANYIVKLIETYNCPYCAVVLDSSKPTFRHELYQKYKANREEMPEELKVQMPLIHELISALNISIIKQDGLEADDLIGSLTKKAVAEGYEVFLITKDKDLMQLIGPKVKMLAPEGTGTLVKFGVDDVHKKLGIGPEKIVDYLALIGDSSDNIPGVPGIGPKTAVKILETCGSVDQLLENPSILENPKLIQKIEENRNLLLISKELATLRDSEPVSDLETLKRGPIFGNRCQILFKDLEFHSLMRHHLFSTAEKMNADVSILTNEDDLNEVVEKIKVAGVCSLYLISTSDSVMVADPVGLSMTFDGKKAYYISLSNKDMLERLIANCNILKDILESDSTNIYGHNLKTIYQILKNVGIEIDGKFYDVMIAAYLAEPGKRDYSLDTLSSEWLNLECTPITALVGEGKSQKDISEIFLNDIADYCCEMVCIVHRLQEKIDLTLKEKNLGKLAETVEFPMIKVLANMEREGILIDRDLLAMLSKEYSGVLEQLSKEIYDIAGESLNLNSPKQIGEVLFDKLQLPGVKKTKNGSHSTNVEVLEKLAPDYPIVNKILEYRELQKLCSTYIDTLPEQIQKATGRVHTTFNLTIASTGRLSSTNPNLQNIPIRSEEGRRIRKAFIAKDGFQLIAADYSQIELRILAHLSGDPFLQQAFQDEKDIHTLTASAIYGCFPEMVTSDMRRAAKTINFGLMYGMGPINLSRQLKISFGEAKYFIDAYFQQFPKIKQYMDYSIQSVRELGFTETMFGRRRYLPEINVKNRIVREAAERTAINTPVQGTAADIIKIAMINIDNEINDKFPDSKMLLQVHDELVFEVINTNVDNFKSWVVDKMSNAVKLSVPIRVDAGIAKTWSDAH